MTEAVELQVHAHLNGGASQQLEADEGTRFEGVAVGTGVFTAQGGLKVRISERHLPLIAERLVDVQIRDLHEERIQATVGAVHDARVEGEDVVFEGAVVMEPHASIVRRLPESIRFSVGFRFRRQDLEFGADDVAELPRDFIIDHIAIVGQGQDPDARLTKLLNEARAGLDGDGMTVDKDTVADLRRQRDEALEAEKQARADLAEANSRLETTNEKLELAEQAARDAEAATEQANEAAEGARLELAQAKTHFADSILKLELRAGRDVDLTERRDELLGLDLGELDKLRLDLADELATEQAAADTGPATRAGDPGASAGEGAQALDLSELSLEDTLRLGLVKGVL